MAEQFNVIAKKEFYKIDRDKATIGLLMMVKNEEKRIHVSLESVVGHVDALIIYDTGSTDRTVEIITEFAEKNKINLYLIQGDFVDFSTSRNVSLEFADTIDVHYVLLLDCNDELQGGEHLREYAKHMMKEDNNGFLVCQHWWSGQYDKYFNVRFVKTRCGWRYRGSVHEWMKDTTQDGSEPKYPILRAPDNIILYQDRTKDGNKSGSRFKRDKELLVADHKKDPKEPRILFYLAQTCQCLQQHDEAFYYSRLRTELNGFQEEKYHSYLRCAQISVSLGHSWYDIQSWFLRAFEHSPRVEPLNRLADYYRLTSKWHMAYMFARQACTLDYPHELILFVDKLAYDYERWHIMGIVAYYSGVEDLKRGLKEQCLSKFEEGKRACRIAIDHGRHKELDEKNLEFYINKEKEMIEEIKGEQTTRQNLETRRQFVERTVQELKRQNPKTSNKQLHRQANNMWKNKRE